MARPRTDRKCLQRRKNGALCEKKHYAFDCCREHYDMLKRAQCHCGRTARREGLCHAHVMRKYGLVSEDLEIGDAVGRRARKTKG